MKRLICLALCSALVFGFVSCGEAESVSYEESESESVAEDISEEEQSNSKEQSEESCRGEESIAEKSAEESSEEASEEEDMEYPIWNGSIEGEVINPSDPAVFKGAWYRKCVSSRDYWQGMEIVVTLPEFDINRYKSEYNESLDCDPSVKNLDNPSMYIGGNADSECDVGLSLSLCLVGGSVSTGSVAFRPFWRYITSTDKDVGGYDTHNGLYSVSANGNNCFGNWHYKYTEYYYLPGDVLKLILTIPEEGKLQLQIKVISESTLESSVAIRKKYGWKSPADFTSPAFSSPGYGKNKAEFKWVMAIDQSNNEGKNAIATTTVVKNGKFSDCYLYREIDGKLYRVPITEERFGSRNAPDDGHITVVRGEDGSETITIHPGYTE